MNETGVQNIARMILTGKPAVLREKLFPVPLSTTNSTYTGTGLNKGLRGERPAANRLSPCY